MVVLLTLASIFLCGIVVTYVANADNFRQKHANLKRDYDGLNKKAEGLTKELADKISEKDELEKRLTAEISDQKANVSAVQAKLDDAERQKAQLLTKVDEFAAVTKDFKETNAKQLQMLQDAQQQLTKVQGEQIVLNKKLDEITAALVERNAIVDTLETEKRRLVEEKATLQNKLDEILRTSGKTVAAVPVTPERTTVRQSQPVAADIGLKGQVSGVDMKNSWASISMGAADGVKEGMKFHVTRGDQFICDILIIDVDTDKAVGTLELVQQQPKAGDSASTNL